MEIVKIDNNYMLVHPITKRLLVSNSYLELKKLKSTNENLPIPIGTTKVDTLIIVLTNSSIIYADTILNNKITLTDVEKTIKHIQMYTDGSFTFIGEGSSLDINIIEQTQNRFPDASISLITDLETLFSNKGDISVVKWANERNIAISVTITDILQLNNYKNELIKYSKLECIKNLSYKYIHVFGKSSLLPIIHHLQLLCNTKIGKEYAIIPNLIDIPENINLIRDEILQLCPYINSYIDKDLKLYWKSFSNQFIKPLIGINEERFRTAGYSKFVLSPGGYISTSKFIFKTIVGTVDIGIHDKSITDWKQRMEKIPSCTYCFAYPFCFGGCRALSSHLNTSTLIEQECVYKKSLLILAGKIISNSTKDKLIRIMEIE